MKKRNLFQSLWRAPAVIAALSVVLCTAGWTQAAPENSGQSFRITPLRSVAELMKEARKAEPPKETGEFEPPKLDGLVDEKHLIRFEIRYATANNFLGEPVYSRPRALLQRPAAAALGKVSTALQAQGYGLLIYDAYRPWFVTKVFWDATPRDQREFVGDPAKGSRHNRGCAVDLTLYDLKTGAAVAMPSGYDEMSPRAYSDYAGASAEEKQHREILRAAMEEQGFTQLPNEWWHFDYKGWEKYPLMNVAFEELPYRVSEGITVPKLLYEETPKFTAEARKRRYTGVSLLRVVIGTNGLVQKTEVGQRPLGAGLDEAARKAVAHWRFQPALLDGVPVPVEVNVEVNFRFTDSN